MYEEKTIQFCCPACGHDTVVRVRTNVTVKESITRVATSPTDTGKSYSVLTGWSGADNGKVDRYECGACKYVLRGKVRIHYGKSLLGQPIKSVKQLYDWIRRTDQCKLN